MNTLISEHTNKTVKEIQADSDRDFYLTAKDALEYGIVDTVIDSKVSS
jgi:ATP-dependent Clp protease protease subunit